MGKYKIQKRRTSTKYRKDGQAQNTEKGRVQNTEKGQVGDNLLLDYWNLLFELNLKRRVKL